MKFRVVTPRETKGPIGPSDSTVIIRGPVEDVVEPDFANIPPEEGPEEEPYETERPLPPQVAAMARNRQVLHAFGLISMMLKAIPEDELEVEVDGTKFVVRQIPG